ncbi:hypothetical protein PIB30_102026, partial [Stylosanthes scabra]|nr:hypothetical protein [Stylosanthes scabra]
VDRVRLTLVSNGPRSRDTKDRVRLTLQCGLERVGKELAFHAYACCPAHMRGSGKTS